MFFEVGVLQNFAIFTEKTSMLKILFKDALSVLRHFLAIKSPLTMIKNAFYFSYEAPFVLKMVKFLS